MDKKRFIENAPSYYALAIASVLRNQSQEYYLASTILTSFGRSYVSNDILFNEGVHLLVDIGMIAELSNDFGPSAYQKTKDFDSVWYRFARAPGTPFQKYDKFGPSGDEWLESTLADINDTARRLNITEEDFASRQSDAEWEPIPLDRSNEQLQQATASLDNAIKEIQGSNGYAAAQPEERAYVIERLAEVTKHLKEDTQITWMYLNAFAFEPLGLVIKRFKDAAVGLAATAAKVALQEWLKGLALKFLRSLMNGG